MRTTHKPVNHRKAKDPSPGMGRLRRFWTRFRPVELYCISILVGECAGVIYVLGITVLKALSIW